MATDTAPRRHVALQWCLPALALLSPCRAAAQQSEHADYGNFGIDAIVVIATGVIVCAAALLHYEVLSVLSRWLARREGQRRRRVLLAIFGVLSVHIAEIWIFGLGYAVLLLAPAFGTVAGIGNDILDLVYLSAMTFTTVGAPDAHLSGTIRFLNGTEALTGLVLITWSASFTFLEMERFWRDR